MQEIFKSFSRVLVVSLSLVASPSIVALGQALQEEPEPGTFATNELFELNEAPQVEASQETRPPDVEPDGDGYTDKEREEAAAGALADRRAEAPDQVLTFDADTPPPQAEGPVGDTVAVVRSFAGIDFSMSGRPIPDVSIARSPNRILQATNAMLRLTDTGGAVISQMSTDTFFGLTGLKAGTTDPKVYFDALGTTKVFVIAVMGKGTPKKLHIAVSRNPDPTNLLAPESWCRFSLDHPAIVPQVGADYPNLGAGSEHLILTSNHFAGSGGGTLVRLIAKNILYINPPTCRTSVPLTALFPAPSGLTLDVNLRTLQPVQSVIAPTPVGGVVPFGYLVSALEYGTYGYRVWSIQRNSTGALVLLPSAPVLASKMYLAPPPAPQPPNSATYTLDPGDGRILQAVGVGNSIWFSQTTGCNNSGTGVNESCANAMQLNVVPGASMPSASFGQQYMIGAGTGVSIWQPSIAITPTAHVALMYHQGSKDLAMSLGLAVKRASTTIFKALPLERGACNKIGSQIRTGDYLGAQGDPSGATFWLAGEKLVNFGPDPQHLTCQWTTFVKEVRP
ncbi:MAG: hypothetical protein ABJC13_01860 [Acidobacteriota bacterium]